MSASKLLRVSLVALLVALMATAVSFIHNSTDGLGTVAWLLSMLSFVVGLLLLVGAGIARLAQSRVDPR